MMKIILLIAVLSVTALLSGCGNPAEVAVKKLFRPSADKDVTASPEYNFSSFTNTIWKTKTKVAIANSKRYTGAYDISLVAPKHFDPSQPDYTSGSEKTIITVLSAGNRLRIKPLLKDQGAWGGVQVETILLDGTNAQKAVYLDPYLLARNRFSGGGLYSETNTTWGVNPDMLDK